jgi:hypothetical protein
MTSLLQHRPARVRKTLAIGALSACGVLATACGSAAAPSSSGSHGAGSTQSAGTTSAAKASLSIVSTAHGATHRWTLRCDPPGGTAKDPAAACSQLMADKGIFAKTKVRVMCPMIMADAASYIVYGTWFGTAVHETVADGGCSLGHWTQLHQIFN